MIDEETRGRLVVLAADAIDDASMRPVFGDAALEAGWSARPVKRLLERELGGAYTRSIWPRGFKVAHLFAGLKCEPEATWSHHIRAENHRNGIPPALLVRYCWRAIHAVLVCETWCDPTRLADDIERRWFPKNNPPFASRELAGVHLSATPRPASLVFYIEGRAIRPTSFLRSPFSEPGPFLDGVASMVPAREAVRWVFFGLTHADHDFLDRVSEIEVTLRAGDRVFRGYISEIDGGSRGASFEFLGESA